MTLKNQSGFTLVELLVAMGLSLFVLGSIGTVFRAQSHTVKGQESRMEAHEYALTVLDVMVREIRNAGYFPSTACDATGGIVSASATSISFQYDKNGDGACSGDDEVITFAFASSNVTRNGQALTDSNVTAAQFTYYPQQTSGTASTPYSSPVSSANFTAIAKVAISLTVQPKSADSQFTGSRSDDVGNGRSAQSRAVKLPLMDRQSPKRRSVKSKLTDDRGITLIVVLMVMVILLSVIGAGLMFSGINTKIAMNYRTGTRAFNAADIGITTVATLVSNPPDISSQ